MNYFYLFFVFFFPQTYNIFLIFPCVISHLVLFFFLDQASQLTCKNCPNGKISVAGSASCVLCPAGTAGATCDGCVTGKFRSSSDTQAAVCRDCLIGQFQGDPGQASCLPCIPGSYNNDVGQSACKHCGENKYTNITLQTVCKSCPDGKSSIVGSASCVSCDAGKAGASCEHCVAGKFRSSSDDPAECRDCLKGFYQGEKGQANCLPCVPSTFQDHPGKLKCTSCSKNEYTNETKSIVCKSCEIGKSSIKGSASCVSCIAGKAGATCDDCESGKYRTGVDVQAAVCRPCNPGFYQLKTQQAS